MSIRVTAAVTNETIATVIERFQRRTSFMLSICNYSRRRSPASVCVSVCPHDKTKMAKTKIAHRLILGQKVKGQGRSVTKCKTILKAIEWPAWVIHSFEWPASVVKMSISRRCVFLMLDQMREQQPPYLLTHGWMLSLLMVSKKEK